MLENEFMDHINQLKILESKNSYQRELELTNWISNL